MDAVDLLITYKSIISDINDKLDNLERDMKARGMLIESDFIEFGDIKSRLHYLGEKVELKCKRLVEMEKRNADT